MKKTCFIALILLAALSCEARHIIGGELFYNYLGPGSAANTSKYLITLKLFRDQNVPADVAKMPVNVFIGIFNNDSGTEFPGPNPWYDVPKNDEHRVDVDPFPPCISNPPDLNYNVGIFLLTVELPNNNKGYTATYQTCCRVSPLTNVRNDNGTQTGSTYTCSIPAGKDNSPEFTTSVDAICGGKPFHLNFSATDQDGDSLVYAFSNAFGGGAFTNSGNANPAGPPYFSVPYDNGYSPSAPLGNGAAIDAHTGIISGIAPDVGRYVVGVSVFSYRNRVLINEHRKDFIVNVTNCDFAGAKLDPKPVSCDGFNVSFSNDDFSPLNKTFYWDFGNPASGTGDTSTAQSPTHIYSDTGVYVFKLIVNRGQQCSDSATQIVKVYPGFFPSFVIDGKCKNSPIRFIDKSKTNYGVVNAWSWNFGNPDVTGDTSHLQNPVYNYANAGNYQVMLTINSSKGCVKTINDTISIIDKPIFLVNDDTLICSIDTLQLTATGYGSVIWTPNYNINNQNSFTPLVSPKVSTTYYATLSESPGCVAIDSVNVKVVNQVFLDAGKDTTICLTDSIRLDAVSNGLHFIWSPSSTLNSDTTEYPIVKPFTNTTYKVIASIGKCNTSGDVTVKVVPYPKADAGKDTSICFPKSYQLFASGGSIYLWSPSTFLDNPNISNPVTTPSQSIRYVVQVNDILGCPKPVFDTVIINVEKLLADAGPRDTSIVVNQPLQLYATGAGAEFFTWSPSTGLSNSNVQNPVAILSDNQQYILNISSTAGCTASDTINVNVYKVKPGIFVPNSFTPNGDGLNDVFRPILIGMKSLDYFRVYNRGGQLMFYTNIQNKGWDGTYKGAAQDPAVFVWIVEGVDYLGKTIFQKGSVTLIR
ncbi:MAG: PKD domain-containing protein [Bacteroidota bacterium]|nr:PKD domain-containing protein [Bacteroidota bacterium]